MTLSCAFHFIYTCIVSELIKEPKLKLKCSNKNLWRPAGKFEKYVLSNQIRCENM